MIFKYVANSRLPPLAWIASINWNTGEYHVEHGSRVETKRNFFVEGVWPGSFDEGKFHEVECFFGSGAVCFVPDEVIFVPSSATDDSLYFKQTEATFVVSNSAGLLLAATDDRLDEFNPDYIRIHDSLTVGIERYEKLLPTKRGYIKRLIYHNLIVKNGHLREVAKPLPPEFTSYQQYRDYFASTLGEIMKNAREPARAIPLRILSTQSSGYDTTAINAIARDYGLQTILTMKESKERFNYFKHRREQRPSDSGEHIAKHLGLEAQVIDRRNFLKDAASEYLYWSSVYKGEDMNLHQVREFVGQGAMLLTGALGDAIWRNLRSTPVHGLKSINDQLERGDLNEFGLSEARLHIGYVRVPAPHIGARSRKSIFDLTNSAEMAPWSVDGTYDRPIPRRIAEEAGVPRASFGQVKLATAIVHLAPYLPHTKELRREFLQFFRRTLGRGAELWMRTAPKLNFFITHANSFKDRIAGKYKLIGRIPSAPKLGKQWDAVLYAYCVNKSANDYAERITGIHSAPNASAAGREL